MALMSASLSGKLSHYWDMKTTNGQDLNYGNCILDRIGSSHMFDTNFDGTTAPYQTVSGLNGSGLEFVGTTSNAALVAPMQWYWSEPLALYEKLMWGPGSGSFTVAWWDYQESLTSADKGTFNLANTFGSFQSNELSIVCYQTSAGELKTNLYQGAGSFVGTFTTSSIGIPLSGWKLWTLVVDKSSPEYLVYLNGSGQSLSTDSNIANLNYPGNNASKEMGVNLFSYRENETYSNTVWTDVTNYKMDSCMIFDGVLSSGEINELYNSGSGVTLHAYTDEITQDTVYDSLQHYYSFDQSSPISSGSQLNDDKGTAHLTLEARTDSVGDGSNEFYIDVSGASGNGTATSGSQDPDWHFVRNIWNGTTETADSAFTMMGSGEPFSVSYWIKGDLAGNGDDHGIIGVTNKDKSSSFYDGHPFTERTNDTGTDQTYTSVQDQDGTVLDGGAGEIGSEALSTSDWNHVLISVDPTQGSVKKIINGAVTLSHSANNSQYVGANVIARAFPGVQSTDDYELTLFSINNSIAASSGVHKDAINIDEVAFFNTALDQRHAEVIYNNGSGFAYTPPVVASGSTSGSLGVYLKAAPTSSGSTSGSLGGYLGALNVESGSASGSLGGYVFAEHISTGSTSGSLGAYVSAVEVVSGSASGSLGGYTHAAVISTGSASGSLGAYLGAVKPASGSASGSLGGYLHSIKLATGSTSGSLGGYVFAEHLSSGTASGSVGGYLVAVPLADASGTITISRPPVSVYSWDTTKNDPSGYRHIESGAYKPAAKSDLIGGFDKQAESGVALNLATIDDLTALSSSDYTGGTKALTVNLGAPSGQNFDSAAPGDIQDGMRVYNIKMWLSDTADAVSSGISPTVYYRTDSTWTKDILLTSASSGVASFPTSEASGVSLGSVESTLTESEITDYVYLFVELPSGTYNQGAIGGLNGGYAIRVSYDFTGEGDLL